MVLCVFSLDIFPVIVIKFYFILTTSSNRKIRVNSRWLGLVRLHEYHHWYGYATLIGITCGHFPGNDLVIWSNPISYDIIINHVMLVSVLNHPFCNSIFSYGDIELLSFQWITRVIRAYCFWTLNYYTKRQFCFGYRRVHAYFVILLFPCFLWEQSRLHVIAFQRYDQDGLCSKHFSMNWTIAIHVLCYHGQWINYAVSKYRAECWPLFLNFPAPIWQSLYVSFVV